MHYPTSEDLDEIYSLLGKSKVEDTSYSKATIIGWFKDREPRVKVTDKYALFSGKGDKGGTMFWCPLAANEQDLTLGIKAAESYGATSFLNVSEQSKHVFEELGYVTEPSRDYFEYLYTPIDIIELKGKKYHAKRNFINGFNLPYEFRTYAESDREELNKLLRKWSYLHIDNGVEYSEDGSWDSKEILEAIDSDPEILALNAVLDDLDKYNCFADVLVADGNIIGFAAGEILPSGIGTIYFEKGDINYKGVYPLLDNEFCKKHFSDGAVKYINKQEDMGLEGLRKSKLSYHPVKFAERYSAKRVRNA